ncbi:MAG TPA: glycosyltransferase family 2 protein [Candidatus Baltobacteraceae bacterium]|nr:glycosyltransferase family 2 protein [Candidatus Baltobacteraceae bacterium]
MNESELRYSIVIPVFNKAELTRQCLLTLPATIQEAGEGEVIVVDNASSDNTPQMLAEFPWVRVIRNERNLGFAGANNQAARIARGRTLVLLNNDTEAKSGWLASMLGAAEQRGVGAVGARLLYPDGTIQHAGVVNYPYRFGSIGFVPSHDMHQYKGDFAYARQSRDLQMVTGACLATPRALYLELGGLDEGFWNGYEDIDYCLKVRDRGLRVVYQADAVLTHYESQSGVQRFRRVAWNSELLGRRWNGRVDAVDGSRHLLKRGYNRREVRLARGSFYCESVENPPATILLHGAADRSSDAHFMRALRANATPIDRIAYAGSGQSAVQEARAQMELRGNRYLALVDTRCELREGWLDELVLEAEFGWNVGAAAYGSELDARCTLLSLRKYPQHCRLPQSDTLDDAVREFLEAGLELRRGARVAAAALATLPPAQPRIAPAPDVQRIEERLRSVKARKRGLVSIVMLSWNALNFTKIALDSIRRYTSGPYEVIIVDNGSDAETVSWLAAQSGIHVIYNAENRGYAAANNQAMAAARGEYVVLLNNDVILTEGWLDGLLAAFDRIPGLGISAPRSNKVAGDQLVVDAEYTGEDGLQIFARERAAAARGQGYLTDRAIGLCLCIDRRVIEEIGGLDERFGLGNFEDDDYSVRARAAGYKIYVCDDVFIHHFGSQSFAANKVDYTATMHANWKKFAAKWGLPPEFPENGYDLRPAIARGFDRRVHFVPLPPDAPGEREGEYALVVAAAVRNERDWNELAPFVRRYASAFEPNDATLLSIAATGELDAQTLGSRIERALAKIGVTPQAVADITVSDEDGLNAWLAGLQGAAVYGLAGTDVPELAALPALPAKSPSALRRLIAARGAA